MAEAYISTARHRDSLVCVTKRVNFAVSGLTKTLPDSESTSTAVTTVLYTYTSNVCR